MKNKEEKLRNIFSKDHLGLLKISSKKGTNKPSDQFLIDSFQEISNFFEQHDKEPSESEDIIEFMLFSRLESIRKSPTKVKKLLSFDFYNLLKSEQSKTLEPIELVAEDPLGILDFENEELSIYEMKNIKKSDRVRPDFLARRKICNNFDEFLEIFNRIHEDLINKKRRLVAFNSRNLDAGNFYVLNGVLLFVEKLNINQTSLEFDSGNRERLDGRTKCIFDNGTESNLLYRSLVKALEIDGFAVSKKINRTKSIEITDEDQENGFIYILTSKSEASNISSINNLFKIGYSSGDVNRRIKNAKNETTYLLSEVNLISVFRCFNMSTKKLESTVHAFFDEVRLNIEIISENGKIYKPREWFIAPLDIIKDAITLTVEDNIKNYFFDKNMQMIVKLVEIKPFSVDRD